MWQRRALIYLCVGNKLATLGNDLRYGNEALRVRKLPTRISQRRKTDYKQGATDRYLPGTLLKESYKDRGIVVPMINTDQDRKALTLIMKLFALANCVRRIPWSTAQYMRNSEPPGNTPTQWESAFHVTYNPQGSHKTALVNLSYPQDTRKMITPWGTVNRLTLSYAHMLTWVLTGKRLPGRPSVDILQIEIGM